MKHYLLLLIWSVHAIAGQVSLNFENDVFFQQDAGYTNGVRLSFYTPTTGNTITNTILPLPATVNIHSVYQFMYTPDDIEVAEPQVDDRPWAGVLGYEFLATTTNIFHETFYAVGIQLGVTGEYSLVEETQKAVHKVVGSRTPQGWDNQLPAIPAINLLYVYKLKHWHTFNTDMTYSLAGSLGVVTRGTAGAYYRLGWNVPNDFILHSEPVPHTVSSPWSLYLFSGANASIIGYNYYLDASESTVDKEFILVEGTLGGAIQYKNLKVRAMMVSRTKEYVQEDNTKPFGVISVVLEF